MSSHAKPFIKIWEILVSLPIMAAALGFLIQRRDFFYQAQRDLLSEDSVIFYGLILVLTALPGLSLLSKKQTQLGRGLKVGSVLLGVFLLSSFFVIRQPRIRYQAFRSDCIGMKAGFTAFETPRDELNDELVDPDIGPYISKDLALLKYLVFENGSHFRLTPRSARVALASLKALGVSIEEIQQAPQGQPFLEIAMVAEAQTEPWKGLEWVDLKQAQPDPELRFSAGLIHRTEAQEIVDQAIAQLPEVSQDTYEYLLMTMMSFPGLLSRDQGDKILSDWSKNLGQRAEILEPGRELREELCKLFGNRTRLKVSFDLQTVEHFVPEDVMAKDLDVTFQRSVLGLIRSCGVDIVETTAGEAEVQVSAILKDVKLYEYQKNVYELRSKYVPNSRTRRIGRSSIRTGSTKTEAVVVGTETAIRRGPGFSLTISFQGKVYDTEMALLYWYHWVVVNDKDPDYSILNKDGTYGRLWPFGVNEKLLRPHRAR